jgi:thymidylate kinase
VIVPATHPPGGCGRIVEFVGLPGSGKSTVSHAVAGILRGAGRPVSERSFDIAHRLRAVPRRLAKLRLAGRTVLLHPWAALALAVQVARTRQRNWLDGAAKTLELLYVCGLVADRSRRPGFHLLDQGFFCGIASIAFGAASPDPLGRLVEIGTKCCGRPPADLVLVLEVAPATAIERLRRRPGTTSRLERNLASPGFEGDLRAAVASLRLVRLALDEPGKAWSVRVVSEEAARSADTLAAEIADPCLDTPVASSHSRR